MLKFSRLPLSILALTIAAPVLAAEPATPTTHPSPAAGAPHSATAPKAATVDLNTATATELKALPGMTDATAAKVVEGRPYKDTRELVTKKILPESEFAKIKDRVVASHPKS